MNALPNLSDMSDSLGLLKFVFFMLFILYVKEKFKFSYFSTTIALIIGYIILFFSLWLVSPLARGSEFDEAIPIILKHEGKLSDNELDKGGITNYGISLSYLKHLVKHRPDLMAEYDINHDDIINNYDIKNMSIEEAEEIYKTQFWENSRIYKINDQIIATKVFDMAVNMGTSRAIKLFQESLCKLKNSYTLPIDGVMGDNIILVANSLDKSERKRLLFLLKMASCNYYRYIATKHPAYIRFLNGWINRASE